ncbi:MAG: hypothetical protein LAO18_19510 [Acidobacteriia bacterium]|nr:hypothetical protein [Terriglobia bacterium]
MTIYRQNIDKIKLKNYILLMNRLATDNYCRVHKTLRVTPAMEAGLADHTWDIEELVGIIGDPES